MSRPPLFTPGWIRNPTAVQESIAARASLNHLVTSSRFCQAAIGQQLAGTWERRKKEGSTGVFLRDKELLVNEGKYRRPYLQRFGTCVSRGMAKGIQVSLDVALAYAALLKPVEVSFAPIYTLARREVGKGRCDFDQWRRPTDGAMLCDAARAVHDYGVATTDIFAGMTENAIERLAVQYAAHGSATPAGWITASKGHTCETFWCESLEILFDCIAAGYAVPYAHDYITSMPDKNGISDLGDPGNHCRVFTGLFIDEHGETQLESTESWGQYPAGQPMDSDQTGPVENIPRVTLKYAAGEKRLAPGSVGVKAKRFWSRIQDGGEAWGVSAPSFTAESVADVASHFSNSI